MKGEYLLLQRLTLYISDQYFRSLLHCLRATLLIFLLAASRCMAGFTAYGSPALIWCSQMAYSTWNLNDHLSATRGRPYAEMLFRAIPIYEIWEAGQGHKMCV
jgi:hypothetical protein